MFSSLRPVVLKEGREKLSGGLPNRASISWGPEQKSEASPHRVEVWGPKPHHAGLKPVELFRDLFVMELQAIALLAAS